MATTNGRYARDAVEAMLRTGIGTAVIHGEEELAAGRVSSDVDLVVDRPMLSVVAAARENWEQAGLWAVMAWPYDVAGTGSIFLATRDAGEGAQIDVLFDPNGAGRYGVRSGELLVRLEQGTLFPRVSKQAAAVYLLAKRLRKGQQARAEAIVSHLNGGSSDELLSALTRDDVSSEVRRFVRSREVPDTRTRVGGFRLDRIRHPVGAWVDIGDEGEQTLRPELVRRFGRFIPIARVAAPVGPSSWARQIAPVRWRAGLVFSAGISNIWGLLRPDVRLVAPASAAVAAETVVARLYDRLRRRACPHASV